ncbi:MAG: F0F1 ATP synthase subunit B [Ruminococcaceae bacterium]|nr:F0F1 ATP synthase subunit B [Oscillospiraceae bacterium]
MQSLDVISVNLWQIIISLANLLILFLTVKKFLFKPVTNILNQREKEIEDRYEKAQEAVGEADESKKKWEDKLRGANDEAEAILSSATENAKYRGDKIIEEARERAESIVRQAENEAELEYRKANDKIKQDIVDVSGSLAEKMLGREINTDDHRALIDSFIEKIGDDNDGDK